MANVHPPPGQFIPEGNTLGKRRGKYKELLSCRAAKKYFHKHHNIAKHF